MALLCVMCVDSTWCPGFGLALIEMGYDMMDRVRNVPMDQLPVIYKVGLHRTT